MSRGCYEDISNFQIQIISSNFFQFLNIFETCPQQVGARRTRGIWRTTRQTDKRAILPQQTAGRNCYEEVANIGLSRGSYEETALVDFSLNQLAL